MVKRVLNFMRNPKLAHILVTKYGQNFLSMAKNCYIYIFIYNNR